MTAQRAIVRYDYVSFMGSSSTSSITLAVNGSTEKVCSRVVTRCIDVIVLGIFTHLDG